MPETTPNPNNYLVSANGRLGDPPLSALTEVDRVLDLAAAEAPPNGLVIHFHGGLVSKDYALTNIAGPLAKIYGDAGAYPLFFIWESGFGEAIWNNKGDLLDDPAFRELVKKVSEWALKKISITGAFGFRGAGGQQIEDMAAFRKEFDDWFDQMPGAAPSVPPTETTAIDTAPGSKTKSRAATPDEDELATQIKNGLDDDPGFKKALGEALNASIPLDKVATRGAGAGSRRASKLLLSSEALDKMLPPEEGGQTLEGKVKSRGVFDWINVAKFVAKIVIAVIKRYKSDRDHGMYCTVVEEVLRAAYGDLIGAAIWNQMKKDTLDSFADRPDTCGLAVVRKLKALEAVGNGLRKLTLVGHSTGAIYICNFLDMAKKVGLLTPIQVIYLAPAVTCDRFARAIDEHGDDCLKDFRMFAMKDSRETEDQMLKPLYTRSLLYFVSGLLEGEPDGGGWNSILDMPLVGMARYYELPKVFGDDQSVSKVKTFLNDRAHRMVWSQSLDAGDGLNSDAAHHGDFDNDEQTLQSMVAVIKYGM